MSCDFYLCFSGVAKSGSALSAYGFSDDGGDEVEDLNKQLKQLIKFYTLTLYRHILKTVEDFFVNATLICCLCFCLKN